jgi:hypothetical protein
MRAVATAMAITAASLAREEFSPFMGGDGIPWFIEVSPGMQDVEFPGVKDAHDNIEASQF